MGIIEKEGLLMSDTVKLFLMFLAFIAVGVWYFLAGMYGWRYPRLKFECDDDYTKMRYQFLKILLGAALVVVGIGGIITELL